MQRVQIGIAGSDEAESIPWQGLGRDGSPDAVGYYSNGLERLFVPRRLRFGGCWATISTIGGKFP